MRTPWLALVGLALAAAATAAETGAGSFVDRFKAATAAYQAKDYARMEQELREALKLRPAHPTATYNLAAALALRGDPKQAVDTLEQLSDQGLVFDPAADADFASLKDDRGFKGVRKDFARNRERIGKPATGFRLKDPAFIPEGIAYDLEDRHYYVGSVHERRIQRVRRGSLEQDFVKPNPELWAVFGMAADAPHRLLWVASAAVPEMQDAKPEELGRTALLAYDLDSGERKVRAVLDAGGGPHALGDVAVLRDGTVYASDSEGGLLYKFTRESGKFEAVTKPGELSSPQGLALSRDRRFLFVADYTQGLFRFDLYRKTLERVGVADDVCVYGIDGLAAFDNDLIAVQNGVRPHRVVRLRLDDRGRRVRDADVLAANLPAFEEPTLGVVADDRYYFVANSQWNRFDSQHRLPPAAQLQPPLVMRLRLDREDSPRGEPRNLQEPVPQQVLPIPSPTLPLPGR